MSSIVSRIKHLNESYIQKQTKIKVAFAILFYFRSALGMIYHRKKTSLEAFHYIAYCNDKAFHEIIRSSMALHKPFLQYQGQSLVKKDTANSGKIAPTLL